MAKRGKITILKMKASTIFIKWNFMRVLQFILGSIVLIQALIERDFLFGVGGLLFILMAIFNLGCCNNACYTPTKKNKTPQDDVIYEEVV